MTDETKTLGMRSAMSVMGRVLCLAVLVCSLCCFPVAPAFADDTPESSTGVSVTISEEGEAASIEGSPFALESFSRAQVGSNREVDGAYHGYCYYGGSSADRVVMVATEAYVVVFVPESAKKVGLDLDDERCVAYLKDYLIALDTENSKGAATVSADGMEWHFTEDEVCEIDGVEFRFAQELKEGQYYACVIAADGSDATSQGNLSYIHLTHADFAQAVTADDVVIVAPKTGVDALVEFLSGIDMSPLWVTLKTTGTAIVFIFVLGLAAAYFSLRIPKRAQDVADSIFTIPMVLPPTVCGFLLLLLLGSNTALGQFFIDIGFPLIFSWPATVIAAIVVAFPLMYRSARGAFEGLDPDMLDAARTLGWSNAKIFFKLMLPLSWSSIAAGTVLAFARALGEFGATLFLAGNYLGITRTIPIAIYFEWMNGNTDVAIFWTVVIMIFSFIVILFINLWSRRTTKYRKGVRG